MIEQVVSLPWRAVVLRHFEERLGTNPKVHALVAIPYTRTEFQLRFAWCMVGLTRAEYDSIERSKEEKVFLMTDMKDLMTREGAAVACAMPRGAFCFIRLCWSKYQYQLRALASRCRKRVRKKQKPCSY